MFLRVVLLKRILDRFMMHWVRFNESISLLFNLCCLIDFIILEWQETKQSPQLFTIFSHSIVSGRSVTTSPSESIFRPFKSIASAYLRPNNAIESIIPFFNNDRNYFTPAFILKREKVHLSLKKISLGENLGSEKNKFEARISHSQKLT